MTLALDLKPTDCIGQRSDLDCLGMRLQVVTIPNDLGLNPKNAGQIRERLIKMGIGNIKRVSVEDAAKFK